MDAVDVGAQPCGGLRSAGRDEPLDRQTAHRIQALATAVGTDGRRGLGEDVVGEGVAGMDEGAVPLGIPGFQPLGTLREAVDADLLCGDADPGIAAQGFGGGGTEFEARRHVQPEHDHRAVEHRGIFGSDHQQASLEVRVVLGRPGFPPTVRGVGSLGQFVGGCLAREEVLLGQIALVREIACGERTAAFAASNRPRQHPGACRYGEANAEHQQDRAGSHPNSPCSPLDIECSNSLPSLG